MLGHGIRAAGLAHLAPKLLELGLPVAASWQAKDLVDNAHPNFMGCTGVYGNRAANKAFAAADQIIAIGNRLSIWNIGEQGLIHSPEIVMVDCDEREIAKHCALDGGRDIGEFIQNLGPVDRPEWLGMCHGWNNAHPWIEAVHEDGEYINSYRFTKALESRFTPDDIIVTDMGAPLICAHQVLKLKPPQRLMTSGGLGEMGVGLPAAIGAHYGSGKRIICLHADGGMMLNLQELQTIIHHELPIKIIIYENNGYLMIKHTQRNSGMPRAHADPASGVSCPDFRRLAQSMGYKAADLRTWQDFDRLMPQLFLRDDPAVIVYHMDPEQPLVPRLLPIDGRAPRLDEMTPLEDKLNA
jgi:acetolactate synthase-1/2/3 large subunit